MIVSQETVQAVQRVACIEEVVADFVPLKKKGQNFWACCPFHHEHTPSFSVSPTKGFYKCFGCDASGDVINFVQQIEGSTFVEAITYLAQRYGIPVTSASDGSPDLQDYRAKESLYILLNLAKNYYIDLLWHHPEAAKVALPYLAQRAIPSAIAKKFELGYSLDKWDGFYSFAIAKGVVLEQLIAAGLVVQNGAKIYDRFRGRLMFPIHNSSGQVVAFGARHMAIRPLSQPICDEQFLGKVQSSTDTYSVVCEEHRPQNYHVAIGLPKKPTAGDSPKYVNSSETLVYQKGSLLYGLSFAKQAIKQANNCYLVEGYTDVLAFHRAGVEAVVASAGTALTENQIDLLRRFATKVTLVFDGDQAGIGAALRGIDKLLAKGLEVKVISLPVGEDPDSYLGKVGADAFNHYISCVAQDFITFKAGFYQSTQQSPAEQAKAIREIVQSIVAIPDEIERTLLLKKCSKLFAIEEEVLFTTYHALRHQTAPVWQQKKTFTKQHSRQKSNPYVDPKNLPLTGKLAASIEAYEREIMRILLTYGATKLDEGRPLYEYILLELADVAFRSTDCSLVFEYCKEAFQKGSVVDIQCCLDSTAERIRKLAINLTAFPHDISQAWVKKYGIYTIEEAQHVQKMSLEVILRLKIRLVQELIEENRAALKQELTEEEEEQLLKVHQVLKDSERSIAKQLGTVVAQ
ncbi:DNA primase [Cardinium endosymbiont of Philonthus spinipes]|uniref:DNA primase n=1 Tax=Cardinium endosymbiont of Philonthus spinipes TaxID=3077941 RepID=UPI00313AC91B